MYCEVKRNGKTGVPQPAGQDTENALFDTRMGVALLEHSLSQGILSEDLWKPNQNRLLANVPYKHDV